MFLTWNNFIGIKMKRPISKAFKVLQLLLFYFRDTVGVTQKLLAFTHFSGFVLLKNNLNYL